MINLDAYNYEPDGDNSINFPWNEVNECRDRVLDARDFTGHKPCPKCGCLSENLEWIEFVSPPVTWEMLCGRQGPLSICKDCNIQVEFIIEILN